MFKHNHVFTCFFPAFSPILCSLGTCAFAALSASKRHAEKEAFSIHNNRTSLKRRSYAKLPDFAYLNPIIDFHLRHPTPKTHIKILHKYVDTRRGYESNIVDDSEIRQEQSGAPGNAGILSLHLHLENLTWIPQLTIFQLSYLFQTTIFSEILCTTGFLHPVRDSSDIWNIKSMETTWRIIPVGKWLITMVISKSPKDRVVPLPNGLFRAYKWGWS